MTITDIQNAVENIKNLSHDPERAHSVEDALYVEFIRHVASLEIPELSDKAKQILAVDEIQFPRWYA